MVNPHYHKRPSNRHPSRKISAKRRAYLSARAKRQNRNPDGSFAKGFKNNHRTGKKPQLHTTRIGLFNYHFKFGKKRKTTSKKQDIEMPVKPKTEPIAVEANAEDTETIKKQIKSSFTDKELKTVSKDGILIEVTDLPGNKAGEYSCEKDEQGRRHIRIDENAVNDNETVTHEMVHLCRDMDPERKGLNKSLIETIHGERKVRKENVPLEEALTVAETLARTDTELTKNQPGYYSYVGETNKVSSQTYLSEKEAPKDEGKTNEIISPNNVALLYKQHDVDIIKGNDKKRLLGNDSYESISKIFPQLIISRLANSKSVAIARFNKLRRKYDEKP